ncbi:beta-lactamase family protein [Thermobifida halotolerans]|uniref:Beta-lactamase family protein n=3 Tax=Thermobifida halotolerans TaxID=483545 RepID=A0AA97M199_9ACTN|nr:beta-lactamase family protein [Thermobifida halotolerans]
MHEAMAAHVARGELPGLVTLVHRRGETHVDAIGTMAVGGGTPMRRDTIFRIASMTKPVLAVAAMVLVEECRLRLDDPVDPLLPELAHRRVLRRVDGPLEDTVPARRPITLRDLLTFRCGFGLVLDPQDCPIQRAVHEAGIAAGPDPFPHSPDEFMRRLGELPLVCQPGERWLYHTGFDVLGVLVERAVDRPLESFLRERIFEPLGMRDTGFHLPSEKSDRLPPLYLTDPRTGAPVVARSPHDWSRPPAFASGGAGLLSTAGDYLAFLRMLLNGGRHGGERVLSRRSVELMTTNHLTPEQRAGAGEILDDNAGWGFGVTVTLTRDRLEATPGRFGWEGGRGTAAYADPAEDMVGVLLTQLGMDSPHSPKVFSDFWTSAYQAIDD